MTESEPQGVPEPEVHIEAPVRRWCEARAIPMPRRELSDEAALLIAAGHLQPAARDVVINRFDTERAFPDIGGYAKLRKLGRIADPPTAPSTSLDDAPPSPFAQAKSAAEALRAADARRKLAGYRHAFTLNRVSFAAGVRAVRKARKDAVHLDLDERDALFDALCQTPLPMTPSAAALAARTVSRVAGPVLRLAPQVADWVDGHGAPDPRLLIFEDRYDVLLFLAGLVYDKVTYSRSVSSGDLDEQLMQLDLPTDLVQISADVAQLKRVWGQLRYAPGLADGTRSSELDRVWDELVERVTALTKVGDLVDVADSRRPRRMSIESIDQQIHELVLRSGEREISTQSAHRVANQIVGVRGELGGASRQALPPSVGRPDSPGRPPTGDHARDQDAR
ncbi:putative protein OS=Tsukamurella paurometabola (strain ATCC 8368 / DSM / CCUG 35730 /CIP 100753 / JCM 10117 / KCTC 9821 / NBRC 16120 / NCIMB 702349/ NCTC 13040) OX=521096 GN=Tpau_4077 PE=4 SV=1 [Tsukamurella paurometabola]|uniref:Uncharacterized protein n=1 Tax=Tsukamurella paurometabola (strain ATCC 8368 / DSM 20162 / CCUG 35730 / CIP 100753 / JCM 10117 / KCTC 9821 / NBRC 16120 / NCIMB 702349 / NCTC 13040) TaxID=521096 RepID=D5UNF2_TSUPD|nr:hypothetical protein [Tsukamurella paurometabola]ADG80647.1 conserved hypothetical protein [Tsukamurella paurometabola DSM 20162]SUP40421.1 Uncharacterised protein [Tsukamurella paurometabola]